MIYIIADDYGILQNSLCLHEINEWLFDVNLAITYLLTNFYIKKNSQNYCNFYVRSIHIHIKKISVKLVYHKY